MTITFEPAPAKLNLALSVGHSDRADGMHPICSWMVTVDLQDELQVTRLDENSISRYAIQWHPDAPRPSEIDWSLNSDLMVRAHQALERYCGRQLPVQAKLDKRIPLGSGLGGGSSDAAAILRACNQLFDLGLDAKALRHVGAAVGSDVPFLVSGGSAIVSGVGEHIEHCPEYTCAVVLVLPDVSCPTAKVYERLDAMGTPTLKTEQVSAAVDGGPLFNDLAAAALDMAPSLSELADQVAETSGREVHVSGSGSTLFVCCDTELEAGAIASAITERHDVSALAVRPMELDSAPLE